MKLTVKRFLSLFVALIMIAGVFQLGAFGIETDSSEIIEGYLTFKLNDDNKSYSVIDCDTLAEGNVVIPASINGKPVTVIGVSAFEKCADMEYITIPNSITSIERNAFVDCEYLTEVKIPDSVTSIGSRAFAGCYNLNVVRIPDSVTNLSARVFEDCIYLFNLTIGKGVTVISEGLCYGCPYLYVVHIPESVTSIEANAFYGCENLLDVFYQGWEAQWDRIKIADGNDNLTSAVILFENNPAIVYGDVNGDNKVDSVDAMLVLKASSELITFTNAHKLRADVNGDRKINSLDALLILRHSVGLITTFPVEKK